MCGVGHVQKCLGSSRHSLKKRLGKNCLEDDKPIGGKGRLSKLMTNYKCIMERPSGRTHTVLMQCKMQ